MPTTGTVLAACRGVITWAIAILVIAILALVLPMFAAGPLGLALLVISAALFVWAFIDRRRQRDARGRQRRDR